jgi:hypothetical protein
MRRLPEFISGKKTPFTVFLQAVSAGEKFATVLQTPSGGSRPAQKQGVSPEKFFFRVQA